MIDAANAFIDLFNAVTDDGEIDLAQLRGWADICEINANYIEPLITVWLRKVADTLDVIPKSNRGIMEIGECKIKIANVAELLCGGLIVDDESLPDEWDSLANLTANMARHAAVCTNRLAAYAGVARRRANRAATE